MALKKQLPRLAEAYYCGRAYVFWTHTLEDRRRGWLDEPFHFRFREILLHTLIRFHLVCPAYVLMPDHMHLVWVGTIEESNQLRASTFFRKRLNGLLAPYRLQRQAYDHVLRESERVESRFADTITYLWQNPVRAGLADKFDGWAYSGAMVPGYPDLNWNHEAFWETFWKCYRAYGDRLEKLTDGRAQGAGVGLNTHRS